MASALLALLLTAVPVGAPAVPPATDAASPAPQGADRAPLPRKRPVGADSCGLAQYLHLLGGPAPDGLAPPPGPDGVPWRIRVIHPQQPVTKDHLAGRLNLVLDHDGRVLRLYCG